MVRHLEYGTFRLFQLISRLWLRRVENVFVVEVWLYLRSLSTHNASPRFNYHPSRIMPWHHSGSWGSRGTLFDLTSNRAKPDDTEFVDVECAYDVSYVGIYVWIVFKRPSGRKRMETFVRCRTPPVCTV
jgi:hypothetical protein